MTAAVALLSPFASPSVRGNAVTAERIARGLSERGLPLRMWDLSATPEPVIQDAVQAFAPALVHALHAFRVGPLALRLARRAEVPLVVTMTGTDANHDLFDPARAAAVRRVLEGAAAVTVFHESIGARIAAALPDIGGRLLVVPQSVFFEEDERDAGAPLPPAGPGPVVLFPAGIRMVKNPLFPLSLLDRLRPRYPGLALVYVGPALDEGEAEALRRALRSRPWARWLGPVPHRVMPHLFAQADVVLNCSLSEGGMANSVLEALTLGRAVLASDIDGNRSLVEDGVTGFTFATPEEFVAKADRLLADASLRQRLGEAGRARVLARFGRARELDGYLALYARLVPALGAIAPATGEAAPSWRS